MQVDSQKNKTLSWAMSLIEIIVALVVVVIIFAALVRQFRPPKPAQSSWTLKRANAEARSLMDNITSNLNQAAKITAVSGPDETLGYIEFLGNKGDILRYDVADNNYVRFGPAGDLSDLAEPVSRLQFICYDVYASELPITEPNSIRLVKIEAAFPDAAPLGRDKTFSTRAYLRTSVEPIGVWKINKGTALEFNISDGKTPVLCRMDSSRHLCAFTGPGTQGFAVAFTANVGTRTVRKGVTLPFEPNMCLTPDLVKIDFGHYLCAYTGPDDDGWAVVLDADAVTGAISAKTPFEFDPFGALNPSLCRIDSMHYLCAYTTQDGKGTATVLIVDPNTQAITQETIFVYDEFQSDFPRLSRIDSSHYLCVYEGRDSVGVAVVLMVDPTTWMVNKGPQFVYDSAQGRFGRLARIDKTHHLCAYSGQAFYGRAVVLIINPDDWTILKGPAFVYYDEPQARYPALHRINDSHHLCVYSQDGYNGESLVLSVEPETWKVTKSNPVIFDVTKALCPFLSQINAINYLCVYEGENSDGWVVMLNTQPPIAP